MVFTFSLTKFHWSRCYDTWTRDAQCGPTHRSSGLDRIGGAPGLLKVPAGMARRWALEAALLLCGFCSALLLISLFLFHLLSSWQLPQISILACLVQGICKVVHIKQARHEMLGFTFSFPCSGPWPDCAACLLGSLVCLSVAKTAESLCLLLAPPGPREWIKKINWYISCLYCAWLRQENISKNSCKKRVPVQ